MRNRTIDVLDAVFTLASFDMPPESKYITAFIGIMIYSFTLLCNLTLLVVIAANRSLHKPMYLFLFNLSVNDLIGISGIVPRVISDLMSDDRHISFPACVIQALCIHLYGGATLLILSVMAFDRYIAICHPLRYHSIMTKSTVKKLIAFSWMLDFLLMGGLFGLTLRFPFCKTVLANFFCSNVFLLRITCATDTRLNNIYGLFITAILNGIGLFSVVFSYTWILFTCFKNKDSDSKRKALHTCATHLLVFLIYAFSGIIVVVANRFPNSPQNLLNFLRMSFVIFPPSLNPIIYGVKTKEIRSKLKQVFVHRTVSIIGNTVSGLQKARKTAQ
ncbi:putative gustatory receptor clone PTE01 [Conger conger]|uniref:putative gustatory receptor clone PTE01 n=1 Tax=Conger conger TaxID=82655 RepID=UPI002A5A9C37|nr:putative gustatory receptor clone PTE01 [Conger conger]